MHLFKLSGIILVICFTAFVFSCPAPGGSSSDEFTDDFEDGIILDDGWVDGTGDYTVDTDTGADGTTTSVKLTLNGAWTGNYNGIYHPLNAMKPTYVSWYAKTDQTNMEAGIFALSRGPKGAETPAVGIYFFSDSTIMVNGGAAVPYAANTWYHHELKNINWNNSPPTFDWWLDGVERGAGYNFFFDIPSFDWVDLYNFSDNTVSWIDEIVIRE
ncbi:MAG: hypothetical protein JW822_04885 [Spirochaetales bacterium]|nr:hypothetical protein [Spirochaetales bacterium]